MVSTPFPGKYEQFCVVELESQRVLFRARETSPKETQNEEPLLPFLRETTMGPVFRWSQS